MQKGKEYNYFKSFSSGTVHALHWTAINHSAPLSFAQFSSQVSKDGSDSHVRGGDQGGEKATFMYVPLHEENWQLIHKDFKQSFGVRGFFCQDLQHTDTSKPYQHLLG